MNHARIKKDDMKNPYAPVWCIIIDYLDGLNWYMGVTKQENIDPKTGAIVPLYFDVWSTNPSEIEESNGRFTMSEINAFMKRLKSLKGKTVINYFDLLQRLETYVRPDYKPQDVRNFKDN